MIAILVATATSLLLSLFGTPGFIRLLTRKGYGQFIRDDGPTSHSTKRGTPTMGGVIIIVSAVLGYGAALLVDGRPPSVSALLVLFLMVGMGAVGFIDDFIKISKQRSLGLRARTKFIGQGLVGVTFAVLALQFKDSNGRTPASTKISFIRDTGIDLEFAATGTAAVIGLILFVLWANFLITSWSNGVNLTDGLDGLATGASAIVFAAYVIIGFWQTKQDCLTVTDTTTPCYVVRDPRDLVIISAVIMAACIGFLWWNASPAQIFMGDTGSLALGGAVAAISILSRTEILAAVIGGLFVIITVSVVLQVGWFKLTGNRLFRMAPLQHHFELKGWGEVTIVIRFWLIAAMLAALGLGIFYAEWVVS